MKGLIGFILFIVVFILLLKLLNSKSGNADLGGKIMKDIGRAARELKEDFDKGFTEKDSVVITDSLKSVHPRQQLESRP